MAEHQDWTGEQAVSTADLAKPGLTLYLSTGIESNSRGVNTSVKASVWYTPEKAATVADRVEALAVIEDVHALLLERGEWNVTARLTAQADALKAALS
jgi:hypothetical protein